MTTDLTSEPGQERFEQAVERRLDTLLAKMGNPYRSSRQVKVSALHWPDVVWFDNRLPKRLVSDDHDGSVPVIGFEIESSASMQSIKAAINNLEALKPAIGCIVVPAKVATKPRSQTRDSASPGATAGDAIRYLVGRSWLSIVVVTEEEIDRAIEDQE